MAPGFLGDQFWSNCRSATRSCNTLNLSALASLPTGRTVPAKLSYQLRRSLLMLWLLSFGIL